MGWLHYVRALESHGVCLMNKMKAISGVIVIGLVLWGIESYDTKQRAESAAKQERARSELQRISTDDPLLNLAGCMANHATDASKALLASAVYKTNKKIIILPEALQNFNEIRDALYDSCSETYYQLIVDKNGSFTYPNLNYAFLEVLKRDAEVKRWLEIYEGIDKAKKSTYVKSN